MEVAIIGGGASGMLLASMLNKNKCSVTIFEKNSKLGKKLLQTGNGKCNFTSGDFNNLDDIYNNDFARSLYKMYDEKSCIDFYKSIGVEAKIEEHKGITYYYPKSNKATSVYYNLLDKIISNGINIKYNSEVKSISKNSNNQFEVVISDNTKYIFDKVVISTGGMSYPNTGSDGGGYKLARDLGHSIIKPIPGLSSLKCANSNLKTLKGIRVDACIRVINNETICETGEIQFTEHGVSGIPVLNISRKINRSLSNGESVILSLDFLINKKDLYERANNLSYKKQIDFLCGMLPDELGMLIMNRLSIKPNALISDISDKIIDLIYENLRDFRIEVFEYSGFESAQVTLGGIDTDEINQQTLESNIVKGLYFIGEVIDIDGKCGGYNLQLTYSTARTVYGGL